MNSLAKFLAADDTVRGYIYRNNDRTEQWFKGTPENIASFLIRNQCADQIILTDTIDRLVLNSFGCFIDACPDPQLLNEVGKHLVPMQLGQAVPFVVETYSTAEINQEIIHLEPATCVFRHGEDDFSLWNVDLPVSVIRQVKEGSRAEAPTVGDLLKGLPSLNELAEDKLNLLVWNRNELALYSTNVSAAFIETHIFEGYSVRADLDTIACEFEAPETEINIMWDDLKPETQPRLTRVLGDNGNYDTYPLTTIYAAEMEQGMEMK